MNFSNQASHRNTRYYAHSYTSLTKLLAYTLNWRHTLKTTDINSDFCTLCIYRHYILLLKRTFLLSDYTVWCTYREYLHTLKNSHTFRFEYFCIYFYFLYKCRECRLHPNYNQKLLLITTDIHSDYCSLCIYQQYTLLFKKYILWITPQTHTLRTYPFQTELHCDYYILYQQRSHTFPDYCMSSLHRICLADKARYSSEIGFCLNVPSPKPASVVSISMVMLYNRWRGFSLKALCANYNPTSVVSISMVMLYGR